MKVEANIELLKKDIAAGIQGARRRRSRDKWKAAFVAVYMGMVSAITTICIGIVSYLPDEYSSFFGITSLLTSASLTVVAAWDGIFHHKRLWINSVVTRNKLYELESDIQHAEKSSTGVSQDQTNEFYERYKKIMKDASERWFKIRE